MTSKHSFYPVNYYVFWSSVRVSFSLSHHCYSCLVLFQKIPTACIMLAIFFCLWNFCKFFSCLFLIIAISDMTTKISVLFTPALRSILSLVIAGIKSSEFVLRLYDPLRRLSKSSIERVVERPVLHERQMGGPRETDGLSPSVTLCS